MCYRVCAVTFCLVGIWVGLGLVSEGTSVSGSVEDVMGNPVAEASVSLSVVGTDKTFETKTDSDGHYQISALPAQTYDFKISRVGFKSFRVGYLVLSPGQNRTVSAILEVGAAESGDEYPRLGRESPPLILKVELTDSGAKYTLDSVKVTNLLQALENTARREADSRPMIELLDSRLPIAQIWELQSVTDQAKIRNVRVFAYFVKTGKISEMQHAAETTLGGTR